MWQLCDLPQVTRWKGDAAAQRAGVVSWGHVQGELDVVQRRAFGR